MPIVGWKEDFGSDELAAFELKEGISIKLTPIDFMYLDCRSEEMWIES